MQYEEKIAKIETIIAQLEGGQVPLAKMVELYEQGQALAAECQKELDEAAQRLGQT